MVIYCAHCGWPDSYYKRLGQRHECRDANQDWIDDINRLTNERVPTFTELTQRQMGWEPKPYVKVRQWG